MRRPGVAPVANVGPSPGGAPAGGDTSGGLGSIGPPGGRSNGSPPVTAVDRARERAKALAADATVARIVESDAPATLVAGAQAWLAAQPMRRELVIVSDFQSGTIGSPDLIDLPVDTGVRLEAIAAGGPIAPASTRTDAGAGPGAGAAANAGAGPAADSARAANAGGLILLTGDADRAIADAARAAAIASGAPAETGRIALLFPGHPGRSDLLRGARPVTSADAFRAYERVIGDPLVIEAIAREGRRAVEALSAVETTIDGTAALTLVFAAPPKPTEAAAVVRAAAIAASPAWIPDTEREPEFLTDTERAALTRPTPESATGRTPDESHARWVWMGVLALLLTELLVRRQRRPAAMEETPRARVA
jgi:hypothetical protein